MVEMHLDELDVFKWLEPDEILCISGGYGQEEQGSAWAGNQAEWAEDFCLPQAEQCEPQD